MLFLDLEQLVFDFELRLVDRVINFLIAVTIFLIQELLVQPLVSVVAPDLVHFRLLSRQLLLLIFIHFLCFALVSREVPDVELLLRLRLAFLLDIALKLRLGELFFLFLGSVRIDLLPLLKLTVILPLLILVLKSEALLEPDALDQLFCGLAHFDLGGLQDLLLYHLAGVDFLLLVVDAMRQRGFVEI